MFCQVFSTAFRTTFWNWYQAPSLASTLSDWDLVDPLTSGVLLGEDSSQHYYETVRNRSDIHHHDLHVAGRFELDPYRTLSYSLYNSRSEITTNLLAEDLFAPETRQMFSSDRYRWENLVTRIWFDWLASSRLDAGFQVSFSSNRVRHRYAMFDDAGIRSFSPPDSPGSLSISSTSQIGDQAPWSPSSPYGFTIRPLNSQNPIIIQARSILRVDERWSLVTSWQLILGRKWAFRQAYYDFMLPHSLIGAGNHRFTEPENDRLPSLHQVDTTIIYSFSRHLSRSELRLQMVNLLDRRNTMDRTLIPVSGNDEEIQYRLAARYLPGFSPSVSVKICF